jgi:hypothetical protein
MNQWIKSSDFTANLEQWRADKYPSHRVFDLGITPIALQKAGASALVIAVTGAVLEKALFDHGLSVNILASIPRWLENPVSIFKSDTVDGSSVVVLTDGLKNSKPIILPIELDCKIERRLVNLCMTNLKGLLTT